MRSGHIALAALVFLCLLFNPRLLHAQDDDLKRAEELNQQAIQLYRQGKYHEALPKAQQVLAIWEDSLGPDHPDVALSLNNLAVLYESLGDYPKAQSLKERSVSIWENALGPDHPDVALSLNNLAVLYESLGDYAKAEALYKRSLTIKERHLGPDHLGVVASLNNLAELYRGLGDYPKAEFLHKRSLAIREHALGPDHPDVALSLNNLALLYKSLGDHPKAETLYSRALAIWEKTFGPDHPSVAACLNNLAGVYESSGDYGKSQPLKERSLAIREKAFGQNHPDVALSLNNLAVLYRALGDYLKAEPLYKRSLAIWENSFGRNHPNVAASLSDLASLYAGRRDFLEAHDLFRRAQGIDENLIEQVMGFTSEDQKMGFLSLKKWNLYGFLSLVGQHLRDEDLCIKDAIDVWLRRKGMVLEAQRRFQESLVYSDDPQVVRTFLELTSVRAQLSRLSFGGPGKDGPEVYRKKIADLEQQKSRLEAELSRLSRAYGLQRKIAKADTQTIAEKLPRKTALIEFARVDMFNFRAKGKETKWLPAHYLAFVLHPGKGDKVGMVDLGKADEIDRTISLFKEQVGDTKGINGRKAQESSREIYARVFEPIRKELGGVKEVFISPDGNLNLIPFEVLQGPDGRYLIEDYTFNYLAAGRDIIAFGEVKEKGSKALLMGDPEFDMGKEERDSTLTRLALKESKPQDGVKRSSDMRGLHFTRLPATKEEVESIRDLLGKDKADIYTGEEALEDVLRQKGTPSILHLATHGFFLSDLDLSSLARSRFTDTDSFSRGLSLQPAFQIPPGKAVRIENPLLRSGIALAGANSALKSGDVGKSDGIVTAEKILGLRLRGTDMVVLSACETGLGEVKTGEGVFGLRRAFSQAGARSLVMSMWSVPDKETKELMVDFYRNILSGKMNRCQALRQAALKQIQVVKERYGHSNLFYWGAFVFMGEP
ncbi:MAG: CHAT domain-containing tetratricopeptide repeat protein [Thermodesulfobacteriota bacterium]